MRKSIDDGLMRVVQEELRQDAYSGHLFVFVSINPVAYLRDVLIREQTHPAARIDERLPHNGKPPRPEPPT